jgi:octaprenyl-diphosphate synthase
MIQGPTVLTDLYAPIRSELASVRRIVEEELCSEHPLVNHLCERVESYQGKMLRPALLLLWARASGRLDETHRTLAAVVELVHLATLVHDDVLDEARVRRQHDTIRATNGNEVAVLLGDYLISHAYHLCSVLDDQYAARTIAATTNTVCEGEILQVSHRLNAEVDEPTYTEIIAKKTASLTATCCALGARYASATESAVRAAYAFGTAAGIAFQIVDDLLDLIGNEAETGKSMGRDLEFGTATLPIIHALAVSTPADRARLRAAVTGELLLDVDEVRRLVRRAGGPEYARSRARHFVADALEQLRCVPDSPARDSLQAMTEFILDRHF